MNAIIYTDGACSGNPGPGGWAFVIKMGKIKTNYSGCAKITTNNAMELTAIYRALKYVYDYSKMWRNPIKSVVIRSDSAYCLNSINRNWYIVWKANEWRTKENKNIKNRDLWILVDDYINKLKDQKTNIFFEKIKGHSGIELNELVDRLAKDAILRLEGQ